MVKRSWSAIVVLVLAVGAAFAQNQNTPPKEQAPDVTGAWTGVWSSYNPAQGGGAPKDLCKNLTAKIEQKNGVWEAIFEGD